MGLIDYCLVALVVAGVCLSLRVLRRQGGSCSCSSKGCSGCPAAQGCSNVSGKTEG